MVRKDLSSPQQGVQAVHAALEAARAGLVPAQGPPPHVVLCQVDSIPGLLRAAGRIEGAGIQFRIFHEPDWGGAPTALATEPVRGRARAPFRRFPLLKE